MGIILIVLDPTGSVLTLTPPTLEQHPDANFVQKVPASLYSQWDLSLLRYFKYVNTLRFLDIQRSHL